MEGYRFSKSNILSGIQCAKRLFLELYKPEEGEASDTSKIRRSLSDNAVKACRTLFPGAILIDHAHDYEQAITLTNKLISNSCDCVLFEPAFAAGGIATRARILIRRKGKWRLVEVKSATSVKGYYVSDCAIAAWVIEQTGIVLEKVEIAYIDTNFIYKGNGDYAGLFRFRDLTDKVRSQAEKIPALLASLTRSCEGEMPERETGPHCQTPHHCQFLGFCNTNPVEYPISILDQSGKLTRELAARGYKDVREVPQNLLVKEHHIKIHKATVSGIPDIHPYIGIRLSRSGFPRYYLDFETIQFGVPPWKATSPFEQLLFQWSCHRMDSNRALSHVPFLDLSGAPPMEKAGLALIEALGTEGPIFVYSPFEKSIIASLANRYPHLAKGLRPIVKRFVDLLPLLRKYYYHKAMKGSWSIKSILPTIAPDLSYDNLSEVKAGLNVQVAYREAIAEGTDEERRKVIATQLAEYCKLDTLAMVRIVDFFEHTAIDPQTLVS